MRRRGGRVEDEKKNETPTIPALVPTETIEETRARAERPKPKLTIPDLMEIFQRIQRGEYRR